MSRTRINPIIAASAAGAGIGSFLAMSFGGFWFFGLLIGGLFGYILYQIQEIYAAISHFVQLTVVPNRRPRNARFWIRFGQHWAARRTGYWYSYWTFVCLTIYTALGFCLVESVAPNSFAGMTVIDLIKACLVVVVVLAPLSVIFRTLASLERLGKKKYYLNCVKEDIKLAADHGQRIKRTWNDNIRPDRFAVNLIKLIGKAIGIVWLGVMMSPRGLAWCGGLIVYVVRSIHSEARVACSVNAFLGSAIGYYAGSFIFADTAFQIAIFLAVLIGATAGAILGWLGVNFFSKSTVEAK